MEIRLKAVVAISVLDKNTDIDLFVCKNRFLKSLPGKECLIREFVNKSKYLNYKIFRLLLIILQIIKFNAMF